MRRVPQVVTICVCGFVAGIAHAADTDELFRTCQNPSASFDARLRTCNTLIDSAAITDQARAQAFHSRGWWLHSRKNDYRAAIHDFTSAISLDPTQYQFFFDRASMYQESKHDLDRAIADYTEAIRLNSNYVGSFSFRGRAYFDKGEFDSAIRDFDYVIEHFHKLAYYDRGNAYAAKHDYRTAIEDYDQDLFLRPNDVSALVGRGNAYRALKKVDLAINDYELALKIDPQRRDAYSALADLKATNSSSK